MMKTLKEFIKENSEYYTLELIDDNKILKIFSNKEKSHVEVRGNGGYEIRKSYNDDTLHNLLDQLDPATVSTLFSGASITLNPKNSRSKQSIEIIQRIMKENK